MVWLVIFCIICIYGLYMCVYRFSSVQVYMMVWLFFHCFDQRTALIDVFKYRIQSKAQGVYPAKAWFNQLVLQNSRDKISGTDDSLSSGKMSSR